MDKTCLEIEYQEKILKYQEEGYQYLEQINCWVASKTEEAVQKLLEWYRDENHVKNYETSVNELAYGHLVAAVTEEELKTTGKPEFIKKGNSVQELKEIMKQIEFAIWRMEFIGDSESEERMYQVINAQEISMQALGLIIRVGATNPENCYLTMTCVLLDRQAVKWAGELLSYAANIFPDNEQFVKLRDQLCKKAGD